MTSRRRSSAPDERRSRLRRGRLGEWAATLMLIAKGYRILATRHRTPLGEIDLIAVRGRRIAFIEVKRRATNAEAEAAITEFQARRIVEAAEHWLSKNPRYQQHEMGLDAIFVLPWTLPRHLPNSLADW